MIKKITIKNFKSIETLESVCNENFNVIIGENNIGKTTIFEAIHLWKICYDSNIKKDKKQFYAMTKNIPFKDMDFLRVYVEKGYLLMNVIICWKRLEMILMLLFLNIV